LTQARDAGMRSFVSLLSESELVDLRSIGRIQRFAKGARLLSERQVGDRVMALIAGRVKIVGVNDAGRDAVFGFRSAGDLVGELAAIDGHPRSGSVEALEPVEALTIATADFLAHLERHPRVALVVMRLLCERLRDADRKRIEFAAADSVGRVAARLLELAERFGEPAADGSVTIDLPMTQEELAGWTGSSREAVARALQTMRELGWVQTARRRITLCDQAALRARAG
jgi:CRP/FNR family cyclic AMP-dependent transcriptional regulator